MTDDYIPLNIIQLQEIIRIGHGGHKPSMVIDAMAKQLLATMQREAKLREALFKIEGLADGEIERIAVDALCSSEYSDDTK